MPTLAAAKAEARKASAAGDHGRALFIHGRIAERFPYDHNARIRVGDTLSALDLRDLAATVYRAAAQFAAKSGHPLPALVACRALEEITRETDLYGTVASLYSVESPALGKKAARLSVDLGGGLSDKDLAPPGESIDAIAHNAASSAGRLDGVKFPDSLPRISLLSALPAEGFVRVVRDAKLVRLRDGAFVFREGEAGHSLFLVADGQLRVVKGQNQELGRMSEGGVFGELALLTDAPRTASVQTVEEADLFELQREALDAMAASVPGVGDALTRFKRERLLQNVMHTSPLFAPFTPEQRHELLARFKGLEVDPETVIIRQGERGRGLYVVAVGEFEVVREQDGLDVALATVGSGGLLGEIALLRDRPATATVTAKKKSTLLFLEGELFRRLVAAVDELRAYFDKLAQSRLKDVEILEREEFVQGLDITFEE